MRKLWRWFWLIVGIVAIALGLTGNYFYNVAIVPGQKSFIKKTKPLRKSDPLYAGKLWYQNVAKETWHITAAHSKLKLVANYIPAAHTTQKTALVIHGFNGNKSEMGAYAAMFHQMGYNVLVPDLRGQGDSQGNVVGFGWLDRLDDLKWVNKIIAENGSHSQIVMFGISMGASSVVMASGENVPAQVKAMVVDSPFTTADAEISHQAKALYGLPRWPLVPVTSLVTKLRAGYSFKEADGLKAVRRNKTPIFFIAGLKDTFVPYKMSKQLYHATKAPKAIWFVPKAKHVMAFSKQPQVYPLRVQQFLAKYVH